MVTQPEQSRLGGGGCPVNIGQFAKILIRCVRVYVRVCVDFFPGQPILSVCFSHVLGLCTGHSFTLPYTPLELQAY